jgi:tetratricopeptide (TPR) repeat protein
VGGFRFVADTIRDLLPPSAVPFVGREKERAVLSRALSSAKGEGGQTWLIEGPAGIGKTRLVRWLEEEAVKSGFRALWGYCLKESNMPFFPFQQIFRHSVSAAVAHVKPVPYEARDVLPLLTILEDERPHRLLEQAAVLSASHACCIVTRELPSKLREQLPYLSPGACILQLTKGGEGEDSLSPGHVDAIGERLSQHLKSSQGAVVALAGLDYLVSQNGFQPVLRLVQFLREEAQRAEAHVILSVNPAALEKRELALLEGEGEALRGDVTPSATAPSGPEPPAMTMMRYLDTLEREAPQQPRLLIIDDVQWADPDSLRTLQFLARNIRSLPVLLVGTMRVEEWRAPEELTKQVLDEILGKIDEEGALLRLQLRGLGDEESQDLAERTIGLPLRRGEMTPESKLLSIFERAEGNPYFVQETMRQLVREGLLRREGDHAVLAHASAEAGAVTSESLPIPPTLRRLVARGLSMLTREEADLLRWAAVAGSEFDLAPLAAALHRPGAEVSTTLRRLERNLHVLEAEPGENRWSFAHPLLWEVALSEIDPEELRLKALVLADWWADHRAEDVETVARLYHDALESGRGLLWVRKALDVAISQHAPETVERYHRWLQDLLHTSGAEPGGRLKEGMAVCERHMLEIGGGPALSHMLELLANLPATPGGRVSARILLAYTLVGHDAREARAQMDLINSEISRNHGRLSPKWDAVRALVNASLLSRQGKLKSAIEELRRLSKVVEEVEEPWVKGRVAYLRGYCCAYVGLISEAKDALAELRDLARTSGHSSLEGWCLGLDSELAEIEGDLRQSEESDCLGLLNARSRGDVRNISITLANAVAAAAYRGRFDVARTSLLECQRICNRFGLKDIADFVAVRESDIMWGEKRWTELVRCLAETLSRPVADETGRAVAQSFLAEGYVELGDLPSARAWIDKAEQRRDELQPGELANMLRVRARVLEVEGDPEAGRKTLEEALCLLEEHPNMFWGAWVKAEIARWESKHGDRAKASTFRVEAESFFERSGVLPAGKPKWMQDIGLDSGGTKAA